MSLSVHSLAFKTLIGNLGVINNKIITTFVILMINDQVLIIFLTHQYIVNILFSCPLKWESKILILSQNILRPGVAVDTLWPVPKNHVFDVSGEDISCFLFSWYPLFVCTVLKLYFVHYRPVRLRMNLKTNMEMVGKRFPYWAKYKVWWKPWGKKQRRVCSS